MESKSGSKTMNSSRNVVFGFALKVYQLLMPFIEYPYAMKSHFEKSEFRYSEIASFILDD